MVEKIIREMNLPSSTEAKSDSHYRRPLCMKRGE